MFPKLTYGDHLIYSATFLTLLSGCGANFNSIYRSDKIDQNTRIVSDDAKQRVLIYKPAGTPVACLEPSPDALSAFAASFTGNISSPEKFAAAISGATSESAGSIGLRTPSIQLLRDQGYRICEGFANGALDKVDYSSMMRRNQAFTTAILAIEQLTGTVKAQQVILNTAAGAGAGAGLNDAQQHVVVSQDKVTAASKAVDEAKAKAEASAKNAADLAKAFKDGTPIGGKPVAQADVDQAQATAKADQTKAEASAQTAINVAKAFKDGTPIGGKPVTQADVDQAQATAKADQTKAEASAQTAINVAKAFKDGTPIGGKAVTQVDVDQAQQTVNTDKSNFENKKKELQSAQNAFAEAKRVRDAHLQSVNATSSGQFGASVDKFYTAQDVPAVVNNIVRIAFNKTFLTDFCQMYWAGSLTNATGAATIRNEHICNQVLNDALVTNRALNGIAAVSSTGDITYASPELIQPGGGNNLLLRKPAL